MHCRVVVSRRNLSTRVPGLTRSCLPSLDMMVPSEQMTITGLGNGTVRLFLLHSRQYKVVIIHS